MGGGDGVTDASCSSWASQSFCAFCSCAANSATCSRARPSVVQGNQDKVGRLLRLEDKRTHKRGVRLQPPWLVLNVPRLFVGRHQETSITVRTAVVASLLGDVELIRQHGLFLRSEALRVLGMLSQPASTQHEAP